MEDHLLVTMLARNVNQNPECRRFPIYYWTTPTILESDHKIEWVENIGRSTKRFASLWKIGCPFELSALRHWSYFGSVYRNTFSMLTRSSNPILLHNQRNLCPLWTLEWWNHPAIWLLRFPWSTARRVWDSLPSSKPLFGNYQSNSEIPYGQRIFRDPSPKKNDSELSCHFEYESRYESRYPRHGDP